MFSASYIKKCIVNKNKIDYIIKTARGKLFQLGKMDCNPAIHPFKKDDFFHQSERMAPTQVEKVNEISDYFLRVSPEEDYPAEECVLIPTEEQLDEGLVATHYNVGQQYHGNGPEVLLDEYLKCQKRTI